MTIGFGWWHKYAYSDRSLGTVQVVSLDIAWHFTALQCVAFIRLARPTHLLVHITFATKHKQQVPVKALLSAWKWRCYTSEGLWDLRPFFSLVRTE